MPSLGRPVLDIDEIKDKRVTVRLNHRQARRLNALVNSTTIAEATLVRFALQHFLDNHEHILNRKDTS